MGDGEVLSPRPDRRAARGVGWVVLFLAALALRVVAVGQYEEHHPHADRPVIDEASYERWALAIAGGSWLGDEVFFQEPLYPYFVGTVYAALGHDRLALRLIQALLGAATCVGVGLLGRRLFGTAAGFVAGGALALHSPALLFPSLLLKPNLFLPVLAALAWLLLVATRGRRTGLAWWATGVFAGLGALLRGNVLMLLPWLVLWPLARTGTARRARLAHAGLVLLGSACVLLPVAARNQVVGGAFLLTTSGAGTNLYGGNNAENRFGVATEFPWVRGIPEYEADDWRREAERRSGRALDGPETSRFWMGELWRSVRTDPGLHVAILWRKLRLTLGAYEVPDNHDLAWSGRYVPVLRLPLPGFGLTGALAVAGLLTLLVQGLRRAVPRGVADPRGAAELGALVLLYLATIVLTVTSMRARLPLVPLLAPFGGWFLVAGWERLGDLRGGRRAPAVAWGLAIAVALAVVHAPVLPAGERERDQAERSHNLAVELLREEGGVDAAAQIAAELAAAHPDTSRFQILLAETEFLRAVSLPRSEARPLIQSALDRLRPLAREGAVSARERFRSRRLAGRIQLWLGNAESAERHLRAARAFDPDDAELRESLARALLLRADAAQGEERERLRAEAAELLR